ncbi:MAG: deoxyribose-phosphate aldolase [candidate division WOR-3 bacterium]
MKIQNINKYIDHTLLKPEASEKDIKKLCAEAKRYNFATVFVNPCYVNLAKRLLKGSDVKVGCAIGFPLGSTTTEVKVLEAMQAVANGADEIDMVINIGAVKSRNYKLVEQDIKSVVKAVKPIGVKTILETCLLTDDEKVKIAKIAKRAGAKFVKTSTGFSSGGATIADIKLLRKAVGKKMGVKASGGIRDYKTALAMIKAGANRIGTSAGVKIIDEAEEK